MWRMSFFTCLMSGIRCQVSGVTCHISGVSCQVSHVTYNSQTLRARKLKFLEKIQLLPPVTCHVSCVMCHISHVKGIFFDKVVKLFGRGLLTGLTPSSFWTKWWSLSMGLTPSSLVLLICLSCSPITFTLLLLTNLLFHRFGMSVCLMSPFHVIFF